MKRFLGLCSAIARWRNYRWWTLSVFLLLVFLMGLVLRVPSRLATRPAKSSAVPTLAKQQEVQNRISATSTANATTLAAALYQVASPLQVGSPSPFAPLYDVPSAAEEFRRLAPISGISVATLAALREGDRVRLPLFDGEIAEGVVNLVKHEEPNRTLIGGALVGSTVGSFNLGANPAATGGLV